MIVLADNDILLKLARCDLFDEFLKVFDISQTDVYIVPTVRFSLKNQRKRIDKESFARLESFLLNLSNILVEPDELQKAALADQPNIDAGEVVLFASCPLMQNSIIVTGDKRCLTGLMLAKEKNEVCARVYNDLAHRICCFEQILMQILDKFEFNSIRQRLIDGRECDTMLKICIGSGLDVSEEQFRLGLNSYISSARQSTGDLLID